MRPPDQLLDLHAALRAAYQTYRDSHWRVKGNDYYGNHLLLQRLYTETEPMIDALGERITGLYGDGWLEGCAGHVHIEWTKDHAEAFLQADPMQSALEAAQVLHEIYPAAYEELKHRGELTLGLDDLLMAQQNTVESHLYLLQQALDAKPVSTKKLKTMLLR